MRARFLLVLLALAAAIGLALNAGDSAGAAPARIGAAATPQSSAQAPALPPVRHVFVIVLENESATATFPASGPAPAPYLADTMRAAGAFLPNYYGTGHSSNDNYISMISGQAPNTQNSNDCLLFDNFTTQANTGGPDAQQEGTGCVYPSAIQTVANQLDAAGLSWKDYNEDMGNIPSREASTCAHPALNAFDGTQSETAGDAYATRHNPFVYFHSIIDDPQACGSHVVSLAALSADLQSAAGTPDYVFITPNLCHDGHDATCKTAGENGGFSGINDFLSRWVPLITNSPAYRDGNGLLITTFDESSGDASACCGETAGPGESQPGKSGPGGGRVGAVLMSPCIAPGTVSETAYNHYSMLASVEDLFGLSKLGEAAQPGLSTFGPDVFTAARACSAPPGVRVGGLTARPARSGHTVTVPLRVSSSDADATFTVQMRQLGPTRGSWRTLLAGGPAGALKLAARAGHRYAVRVRATNGVGISSAWVTRTFAVALARG